MGGRYAGCENGEYCGPAAEVCDVPSEPAPDCEVARTKRQHSPAPPMMPPGRFFPVPTHPVFERASAFQSLAPCGPVLGPY